MRLKAHFYMSLDNTRLAGAYNRSVDFKVLREALRAARERSGLTLDEVEEQTPHNRATVHKIENVKTVPDYKPDLETIEHLVVLYNMTLSSFFAEVERAQMQPGERAQTERTSSAHAPMPGSSSPPPQAFITGADLERFGRALGESIGRAISEHRTRTPKEKKPKGRFHPHAEASDRKDPRAR